MSDQSKINILLQELKETIDSKEPDDSERVYSIIKELQEILKSDIEEYGTGKYYK